MTEENKQLDSVVFIHLLNGESLICGVSNLNDNNWVTISNPYSFVLNPLDNKTIQFVPYLNEFTNDELFDINVNSIVSMFKPHTKYAMKYIEIVNSGNNVPTLLNE